MNPSNPNQLINNMAQKMPVQKASSLFQGIPGGSVPPVAQPALNNRATGAIKGGALGAVGGALGKIKNAIVNKMSPNIAQAQTADTWIPTGVARANYSQNGGTTNYDYVNPQQYYMTLNRKGALPSSAYAPSGGIPSGYDTDSFAAGNYEASKVGKRPFGSAPDTDAELAPWLQSSADRVVVSNPFANGAFDNLTPEQKFAAQQMMADWNPSQSSAGPAHQSMFTDRGGLGFTAKSKQSGQDYYRQHFGGYNDADGFHPL